MLNWRVVQASSLSYLVVEPCKKEARTDKWINYNWENRQQNITMKTGSKLGRYKEKEIRLKIA